MQGAAGREACSLSSPKALVISMALINQSRMTVHGYVRPVREVLYTFWYDDGV
jgi:hypothetical protein